MRLSHTDTKLVNVTQGMLIAEDRVALSTQTTRNTPYGVLTFYPGSSRAQSIPLRVYSFDEVPVGVLGVGTEVLNRVGVLTTAAHQPPWQLELRSNATPIKECTFELLEAERLDMVVERLSQSRDVAGRLLHIPMTGGLDAIYLSVDGIPYRVNEISPPPVANSVMEFSGHTLLRVQSSTTMSGTDIVVLADCSGSMTTPDVTPPAEDYLPMGSNHEYTRMNSQKDALEYLISLRLRTGGRSSQLALVGFNHQTMQLFPRSAGMKVVDDNSDIQIRDEFHWALSRLEAKGNTDIPRALTAAADILLKKGNPANEKLIVLISDGADYNQKDATHTGEQIKSNEDAVTLMRRLHQRHNIRIHAIGLSTVELYQNWVKGKPVEYHADWLNSKYRLPNHQLLIELMKVGGGNTARFGDTEVLMEFFTNVATGNEAVAQINPASPVQELGVKELKLLVQEAKQHQVEVIVQQEVAKNPELERLLSKQARLQQEYYLLYHSLGSSTEGLKVGANTAKSLFDIKGASAFTRVLLSQRMYDYATYSGFILAFQSTLWECVNPKIYVEIDDVNANKFVPGSKTYYEIPEVAEVFIKHDVRRVLNPLRNRAAHKMGSAGAEANQKQVLADLIGTQNIDEQDRVTWAKLGVAILECGLAMLKDIYDIVLKYSQIVKEEKAKRPPEDDIPMAS